MTENTIYSEPNIYDILFGEDKEVEKNTFLLEKCVDSGVLHHYFDRNEIERIFSKWTPLVLAEQVIEYMNVENDFWKTNPFQYTKRLVLMKR